MGGGANKVMKKRAMKKWIPKETGCCYGHLVKVKGSWGLKYVGHCKWRKLRKHIDKEYGTEKEWYCAYLGKFDDELECGLLWDACKECGEHYETDRYWNRCARRDYNRKRGRIR